MGGLGGGGGINLPEQINARVDGFALMRPQSRFCSVLGHAGDKSITVNESALNHLLDQFEPKDDGDGLPVTNVVFAVEVDAHLRHLFGSGDSLRMARPLQRRDDSLVGACANILSAPRQDVRNGALRQPAGVRDSSLGVPQAAQFGDGGFGIHGPF